MNICTHISEFICRAFTTASELKEFESVYSVIPGSLISLVDCLIQGILITTTP